MFFNSAIKKELYSLKNHPVLMKHPRKVTKVRLNKRSYLIISNSFFLCHTTFICRTAIKITDRVQVKMDSRSLKIPKFKRPVDGNIKTFHKII